MIYVYVAKLPKESFSEPLLCIERQKEVDGISNEKAQREKYYVWRLLEYAIKNSLGADASRLCFTKGKNRKWSCEGFEFSLSHSGDALAVAISDMAVGIDVEKIRVRNAERMAEYMLTQSERGEYDLVPDTEREEWLIRKWCQKEASFKLFGGETYKPSSIELDGIFLDSRRLELANERYVLAVATDKKEDIRLFEEKI